MWVEVWLVPSGAVCSNHTLGAISLARCQRWLTDWLALPEQDRPITVFTGGTRPYGKRAAAIMRCWVESQHPDLKGHPKLLYGYGAFDTYTDVEDLVALLRKEGIELAQVGKLGIFSDHYQARRFHPTLLAHGFRGEKNIHEVPRSLSRLRQWGEALYALLAWVDRRGKNPLSRLHRWRRNRPKRGYRDLSGAE